MFLPPAEDSPEALERINFLLSLRDASPIIVRRPAHITTFLCFDIRPCLSSFHLRFLDFIRRELRRNYASTTSRYFRQSLADDCSLRLRSML